MDKISRYYIIKRVMFLQENGMDIKVPSHPQKTALKRSFTIKLYNSDRKTNKEIRQAIESIFSKYKRSDLTEVIFFCVKELINNAIMMNVKSLYFKKNELNINNIADYVAGMTRFNDMIEKNETNKYFSELPSEDLWVKFHASHSKNGLKFLITNNSPIVGIEERQIRMKLQKSMIYIDLIDLNSDIGYDPYDEKMGLALVAILLKKANLDVSLFRIGTANGITLSRIEVPFSKRFRSGRKAPRK